MDFRPNCLLIILLFVSCTSHQTKVKHDFPELDKQTSAIQMVQDVDRDGKEQQKVELIHSAIEKPEVVEKIIVEKQFVKKSITDFNLNYYDGHFKFWVNYFSTKNKERFVRFLKNGRTYEEIIETTFKEEGLPMELYYVGLIESGFQHRARSHAGAVGPWQFIRGTAKRYGLRVDRQVDERKSIYKSTLAAARYFKDLYNIFGSWELALCAYNAGEYRVIRAIRKGNTRDYKALVKKKLLPKETIHYVPKVAAARFLSHKKGFQVAKPKVAFEFENVKELDLKSSFSVKSFAKHSGINEHILKKFNPDIRWDWVKVGRTAFTAYVPSELHNEALAYSKTRMNSRSFEKVQTKLGKVYRVKAGDNLTAIADKFGMNVRKLKKLNDLKSSRIYPGQKIKVSASNTVIYIVRQGDNLYRIAKRFGTSIGRILSLNNLKKKTIYPSQKLWVPSKNVL